MSARSSIEQQLDALEDQMEERLAAIEAKLAELNKLAKRTRIRQSEHARLIAEGAELLEAFVVKLTGQRGE